MQKSNLFFFYQFISKLESIHW